MGVQVVAFENFEGGWSTDKKVGIKNSAAYTQSLDFRKSPSQISVLPGTRREDKKIIKDLILNEVVDTAGNIYATGDAGWFYKRATNATWSAEGKLTSGCGGIDYRKDADAIYLSGNKTVSLYQRVSGTLGSPSLVPDKYGISFSTYNNTENAGFNVSSYQVGSQLTTSLLSTLKEESPTRRYFQTNIEPLNKITVFCIAPGTGDWTLTLHDGLDNVLGTSTVTAANIKKGQAVDFAFPNATNQQVRLYVAPNARTYHFHLTSSDGTGTVSSTINNDLSSCDLQIWADRLVQTNNRLHPIERFLQYEAIGNGNYLSVWEPLSDPPTNDEWLRHKLVFPEEYEVCGLAVLNEYLAIACERTSATGVNDGIIFWWDGLSPTYNYFTAVPEGAPYSIRQYKNVVYYYAGGAEYAVAGANSVPIKVRTLPGTDTEFSGSSPTLKIYPYGATTRRGIHLLAYPSVTTNTSIDYGIYSWGAVDKNYPQSFGYSYLLSTGAKNYTAQNNLQIGMVKNINDLLHISWRDDENGGYGIDVVDNSSQPAAYSRWESLIFDNGYLAKQKTASYMEVYWASMPDGATVTMEYQINRSGTWTSSEAFDNSNVWLGIPNYARFSINDSDSRGGRFYEIQVAITIECDDTVTTPPQVTMVSLVYNDGKAEALV